MKSLLIGLALFSAAMIPLEAKWQAALASGDLALAGYWTWSAARVHPVMDIVNKALQPMAVVTIGYLPLLLAGVLPLFTAYAILQHANVSGDFGSLRRIFTSPKFHRWHHTSAAAGQDKNFAGLL